VIPPLTDDAGSAQAMESPVHCPCGDAERSMRPDGASLVLWRREGQRLSCSSATQSWVPNEIVLPGKCPCGRPSHNLRSARQAMQLHRLSSLTLGTPSGEPEPERHLSAGLLARHFPPPGTTESARCQLAAAGRRRLPSQAKVCRATPKLRAESPQGGRVKCRVGRHARSRPGRKTLRAEAILEIWRQFGAAAPGPT
jgi:hypothetical protein